MLKNSKGFTLIELLATIVVIGVIVLISVPNMVGIIDKNKDTSYIDDARRMQSIAEYRFRNTDKSTFKNDSNQCSAYSLYELNKNQEFDNTPNSGDKYDYNKSFVVVKKESSQYNYYVYLETTNGVKYANFKYDGSSYNLSTEDDDTKKYQLLNTDVESRALCPPKAPV